MTQNALSTRKIVCSSTALLQAMVTREIVNTNNTHKWQTRDKFYVRRRVLQIRIPRKYFNAASEWRNISL